MSLFSKLFGRKKQADSIVGGLEDFKLLISVYIQSSIAAQLGISNLAVLPALRVYKQTYHVRTVNNKLGLGEKKHCGRMMQDIYGISDSFFKEIDASVKHRCRKQQDADSYKNIFQGFSQDLMMLMDNLMRLQSRLPSFLHKALREMVAKQVHQVLTNNNWKDEGVRKACVSIRKYQSMLGYSEQWMTEYVHTVVMLAKKEPRKNMEE